MPTRGGARRYCPATPVREIGGEQVALPSGLEQLADLLPAGWIGCVPQLGAGEDRVQGSPQSAPVGAEVTQASRTAAEDLDSLPNPCSVRAQRGSQCLDRVGSTGAHGIHRQGEHGRVRLRVRRRKHPDERLANDVV